MTLTPRSVDLALPKGKVTLVFDIVEHQEVISIKSIVVIVNTSPDYIPKFLFLVERETGYDLITKHRTGHLRSDAEDVEIPDSLLKTNILSLLMLEKNNYIEKAQLENN